MPGDYFSSHESWRTWYQEVIKRNVTATKDLTGRSYIPIWLLSALFALLNIATRLGLHFITKTTQLKCSATSFILIGILG
jgi:hypothetical protein